MRAGNKLTTLCKEHRNLVDFEHAIWKEELLPVHRLFYFELDRLPATCHVCVPTERFVSHAAFLQIAGLVCTVSRLDYSTKSLKSLYELVWLGIVEELARLSREVVFEWDVDLITDLIKRKLNNLHFEKGVMSHHWGDLSQENIVEDEGQVL